jgi:disulfide bond formation protein DsbB
VIAILAGVLWLIKPDFRFIILGIFSTFLTSGLGLYHSGIEQKWWSGPTTCTSEKIGNLSSNELFAKIMSAPITRCDEIAWTFANLSMANWNAILSLSLTIVWVIAIKNK